LTVAIALTPACIGEIIYLTVLDVEHTFTSEALMVARWLTKPEE